MVVCFFLRLVILVVDMSCSHGIRNIRKKEIESNGADKLKLNLKL